MKNLHFNQAMITIKRLAVIFPVLVMLSCFFLASCAKQGTPTGGPKDETPPEVISELPPNRTVNFNFNKATITLNEFINLKDPAKEIFISPPMRIKPLFKAAGKKVIIEFQEELKANSTYTINFGNSIVDYTEGNPLVNYEYVFSTGSHIDSLSVPGKVLNAFDHKPVEGIVVMIYQDNNDTIPLDSLPRRVAPKSASRTTKDGSFRINNLSAGQYMLFALEDLNNNYFFDLPNERIAFLDSLIDIEPPVVPEVVQADSAALADSVLIEPQVLQLPADTADTSAIAPMAWLAPPEKTYTMYLFAETDTVQKLMGKKLIGKNLLQYIFKLPADSLKISPVDFDPGRPDWYITEFGVLKDTVSFWLKPGLPDTLRVCIQAGDSIADTSRYILSKASQDGKGRKKDLVTGGSKIGSNIYAGAFDLNKEFRLNFAVPVEDYEPGRIHLFSATDTLRPAFVFSDTLQKSGVIDHKWIPGEYYELMIEDSVFCDLAGANNDTTVFKFKVRFPEDYGILIMNITVPDSPGQFIIQLMNDKEAVLNQQIITASSLVKFDYLFPGNYKLKIIIDTDSNGRWDPGNYGKHMLPERIEYYPSALVIRANWDMQEDWIINAGN